MVLQGQLRLNLAVLMPYQAEIAFPPHNIPPGPEIALAL